MENLVAFGLTLEYFGIKNVEILSWQMKSNML
jgi:hypothetical protein